MLRRIAALPLPDGSESGETGIERFEAIPWGRVSAARQVGGEKQTNQVSETARRAAMRPEGGYVDLVNLTREGSRRIVLRRDIVEIGNSGLYGQTLARSEFARFKLTSPGE
jgi:hypothetical protein